jgi:hypothetical protein
MELFDWFAHIPFIESGNAIDGNRPAQSLVCFDKARVFAVREYAAQTTRPESNKTVDNEFD